MGMKLNQDAFDFAKNLIEDGDYETGGDWSEDQPSTEDENDFLDDYSWDEFSNWYLGLDDEGDKDEKQRYDFPYGDFEDVRRDGVIAAKQRAGQYDYTDIEDAADELLTMIDEKERKNS
jgi:hypothetical protein